MTSNSVALVRWEWFKLRRRWMPWVLLAVLIAATQVPYWAMYALNALGEAFLDSLLLPNGVGLGLTFGNTVLVVVIVIWTSSALGSEYSWGTFRAVLAKGAARWQFLAAIFVLMAATGVAWLLVMCLGMGASGLVVGVIEGEGGIATAGEWSPYLCSWEVRLGVRPVHRRGHVLRRPDHVRKHGNGHHPCLQVCR